MNSISFDYDSSFHPSASVVEIEVDGLNRSFGTRSLRAMIDSGRDFLANAIGLFVLTDKT